MRYEEIKSRQDSEFKRLTGVRRDTFDAMLSVVENSLREFGRPPKLSRADQLLLTLTYWREYRTEFHIGADFGVSESTVCRTIKKIENILISSTMFRLPNKKERQESGTKFEIVLIDATEQPIERPKKNKNATTVVKKSVTHKKHN